MEVNDDFNAEAFNYYLFQEVQAYEDRGRLHAKQGDYYSAIKEFEQLIKLLPDYSDAYLGIGIFYEQIGDLQSALDNYNQAIHVNPDWDWSQPRYSYGDPYYCRGGIKAKLGDFESAIEDYTQRIKLHPEHAPAYTNRGVCFYKLQNYLKASQDWTIASDLFYEQGVPRGLQEVTALYNQLPSFSRVDAPKSDSDLW
jgi:tetratricopeptide (TPR) repeat protein